MSDAIRHGELVLLSGRAAVDPATGEVRAEDFETQATIVIDDVFAVLADAGSSPQDVLRVECWLADRGDFAAWNRIFVDRFPAPRPARTTLVAGLPLPGLLIEIQVTAAVSR
jgi:2-iminobutanoate/2-iminopropanoate deaminase